MKTDQLIHGTISAKNGQFSTDFTAVYSLHSMDTRRPLWSDLVDLKALTSGSWLVMGISMLCFTLLIECMVILLMLKLEILRLVLTPLTWLN